MTADTVESVLEEIAASHPVLVKSLGELRDEWEPDLPPPVVAMGSLGTALGSAINEVTDAQARSLMRVVEQALVDGTQSVRNIVATGFLEALVGSAGASPEASRLFGHLGPRARKYCQDWDTFTGCRTPGVWG